METCGHIRTLYLHFAIMYYGFKNFRRYAFLISGIKTVRRGYLENPLVCFPYEQPHCIVCSQFVYRLIHTLDLLFHLCHIRKISFGCQRIKIRIYDFGIIVYFYSIWIIVVIFTQFMQGTNLQRITKL